MDIQQIEQCVKNLTKESRFNHSKGVMYMAGELAKHYGADAEKAQLAGLVHDCVKNLPYDEMIRLCDEFGCQLDAVTQKEHKLIHAPLGAYYTKNVFGIDDEEIFDAVYYHTTAKADMPLLTKILYIADAVEPNRNYDIAEELRNLAFENIDLAVLKVIDYTIEKLIGNGRMLHSETVSARNYLIAEGVSK